jgi:hypothetical protein
LETLEKKIYQVNIEKMDINDLLNRVIKYVIEGVAVALALVFIPRKALPMDEVITVTIAAAAVFAVLDIFSPSMGVVSRQGAGFGIGAKLVGFP